MRTLLKTACSTTFGLCEQTNNPTYTSSPRSRSASSVRVNGSPKRATDITYVVPRRSSWMTFAPVRAERDSSVFAPRLRRNWSDVRPSPCTAASA